MLIDSMPIAVIMQWRAANHPWATDAWAAIEVVRSQDNLRPLQVLSRTEAREYYLVSGLQLELHPDENDGYFENCIAPEPKVFIMWRMQEERAMPVLASVSYAEGTRMFDSGEAADGVPMPGEIHAWLAQYLREHYRPRGRRDREHEI
jgi:hypothetical protein